MSQQIYLPLSGQYSIPYEFEADTMLVPRGQSSVLYELRDGNLTAAQAIVYLCFNHGSSWNSGATWPLSVRYLSERLSPGMSHPYVHKIATSLNNKGWIETIDEDNPSGYQYRLRHHLCDDEDVPVDKDGKPLKFAVPRGAGGPLERCFDGDISWKAALAWISLKLRSNWKASRRHRRTNGKCHASRTLQAYPNLATQLSEPYHRVNTSRHARTADTQIASGDLSVVPQTLPEDLIQPSPEIQSGPDSWSKAKSSKPMVSIGIPITINTGATVGRLAREVQETATRRHMETGFVIIHKYQEMPQVNSP